MIDKMVLLLSLTWLAHRPKLVVVCFVTPHSPLTSPIPPALVHITQYLYILRIKYERKTKGMTEVFGLDIFTTQLEVTSSQDTLTLTISIHGPRAFSSVVEHWIANPGVAGSIPAAR